MKKLIIILIIFTLSISLFSKLQKQVMKNSEKLTFHKQARVFQNPSRDVPEWEFSIDPVGIITNYNDYQPGSYNSLSLRKQPADAGNGMYAIFHSMETAASTRRVYYTYIDDAGNISNIATIGTDDIHEGYPGIDIDPVSGDPIVTWHGNFEAASVDLEIVVSYDLFHLGSPGLWKAPFTILDEATPSPNAPADEFNWPYAYIGPSPDPNKRRVYVISTNYDNCPVNNLPSENVMIAYADFDENDFNMQSELDWTYRTIDILDDWHMGIPEWIRPFQAASVSDDGTIAFFGYTATDDASTPMADKMYVLINDNYGEGEFTYTETSCYYGVDNPMNQDGTYAFEDPDTGLPHEIYFAPSLCNHQNVIFHDNGTKLSFLGNMNMLIYPDSWYPERLLMYPKIYTYDITNDEFSFKDVFLTGANPNDDVPMLPWDLNEDGIVDEYDDDGNVTWVDGWSVYHYDPDAAFHENRWQITNNDEKGWLAAVWSEGTKARLGNVPEPGFEDWAEYPEIAIIVSSDNGATWSDPIIINAKSGDDNYAPELDGMIPCYIYTGDVIEDMGNNVGRLHLMFLDDNSYGSFIQSHGENLGGTMIYTAIDIEFPPTSVEPHTIPAAIQLEQNYPNPFNPSTSISYNLQNAADVTLDIYNVKGQKVRTLVNEHKTSGSFTVDWNGIDNENNKVTSGVYFYKLTAGQDTVTKKMLMLK